MIPKVSTTTPSVRPPYSSTGTPDAIKQEVYNNGPVTVAITVNDDITYYGGGILPSTVCSNDPLRFDHSVVIVGWKKDACGSGKEYWIIKNSWGDDDWGEAGYMKMEISTGYGACLVNYYPIGPVIAWP